MWRWMIGLGFATTALAGEIVEREVEHAGGRFRVVSLEPDQMGVVWKNGRGKPYAKFKAVWEAKRKEGKKLRCIMNAGIYEPGLIPTGLHVEEGRQLRPLNLHDGQGNFFMKPNGVFLITEKGKAMVVDSVRYPGLKRAVRLAVQSGPLLLDSGKRHPRFRNGSASVKHRNGVGVDGEGRVVLAMTDKRQEVNFWDFAGLFLKLGCQDALFLDGDISQMLVNPEEPRDSNVFAAMFVVEE